MGLDKIEFAGLTLVFVAVVATFAFISENRFPAFAYAEHIWSPVKISESIGTETANFMWNHRPIDLIAQAFVLFGAAVGCLAILRSEAKEGER